MKNLIITAVIERLDDVLNFVNEILDTMNCPLKVQMQINIAVEEIYVNIAHYAYGREQGEAEIIVRTFDDPKAVEIDFKDKGKYFDPLAKPDPDTTLTAEERDIGGLGILMIKKSMDDVTYKYRDGQNILTIRKNF
ncbi:MAG: ATP-binding protein [Lachnospiraceae bacterium]|nr:ATP-binding protein [Lachnospiraceae bacterium]